MDFDWEAKMYVRFFDKTRSQYLALALIVVEILPAPGFGDGRLERIAGLAPEKIV